MKIGEDRFLALDERHDQSKILTSNLKYACCGVFFTVIAVFIIDRKDLFNDQVMRNGVFEKRVIKSYSNQQIQLQCMLERNACSRVMSGVVFLVN